LKILLVYPQYPDTFWSFKYALKFSSRKALNPPLGVVTIAAMLPKEWEKKVIDMNITRLADKDITGIIQCLLWITCPYLCQPDLPSHATRGGIGHGYD